MAHDPRHAEADLLAFCQQEPEFIDRAVADGLTASHFTDGCAAVRWNLLLELRAAGKATDAASLYAAAIESGRVDSCGGMAGITAGGAGVAALHGPAALPLLLAGHARREAWKRLNKGRELLEADGTDLAQVGALCEEAVGICAGRKQRKRSLDDVDAEIEQQAERARSGKPDESRLVKWGLPKCDRYMLPIQSHEFALICARPGVGKSSMLTHLAGHNLMRGLRVAYFSLETSDKAVFSQMAAQRAEVNLSIMGEWMPDHHARFKKAREELKTTKRLMIFDDLLSLEEISARMRLLATSWKPDLVLLDYIGLVQVKGGSQYERITVVSNAMIAIRKSLNCALVCACQLSRPPAGKDGREGDPRHEPTNASLRDSGHLEQDAHRIVMIHWKNSHELDVPVRDYKINQTKCRDGVVTSVSGIQFYGSSTRYVETTAA